MCDWQDEIENNLRRKFETKKKTLEQGEKASKHNQEKTHTLENTQIFADFIARVCGTETERYGVNKLIM